MVPNVKTLTKFLTLLVKEGLSYSSINTARSAVSLRYTMLPLGSHPLISRFMKGVFNLKPTLPKTSVTWDAGKVFKFLKTWHPAKKLSLIQLLSIKVVLLCLLITGQREGTKI